MKEVSAAMPNSTMAVQRLSGSPCPPCSAGAIDLLRHYATPDQAARWLPPMIAGEWTGAMCLTEPQAGSDLGVLRTRAEPLGNGRYALHGQKIFITWGEHDCAG
ncbi:MAG: acyl-CoA dehydrogenase, partial [Acetobacteraceae bacterium]|nr:acyl-CoA dehydrogenase [Acetobacteraceae bacterium]